MNWFVLVLLVPGIHSLNLDYLDPKKLQTKTSTQVQRIAALRIIQKYNVNLTVEVSINPKLFYDNKDAFSLKTSEGKLYIRASTGVAAVWGYNYVLKKYCKSQIAWQVQRLTTSCTLPDLDETVIANDRFRYYQNVCTVSYSFVWWKIPEWTDHVYWMALNGINLALAPVAQEAAWAKVYRQLGMTEDEINQHFTGPAFLSWLRMGNVHGWGGPLPESWHEGQKHIQKQIIELMFQLGIVPVLPAFNGHVPKAFARIFPNSTFYSVGKWNKFNEEYCCGLYLDPNDPLFSQIGKLFHSEITVEVETGHIYTTDPFNEVKIQPWSTALVRNTARAVHAFMSEVDANSVWLLQSWMFVKDSVIWPMERVKTLLTSVPNGRILVLDLQAEQWPQYNLYSMYYGQPFIWSMLHNFGGTLGMFGNVVTINKDVYEARSENGSTMIGTGLSPEGINQNYIVYDLMLESAWRSDPVDIDTWIEDYAERRYGCRAASIAWKYLLLSVYSFNGLNMMRGKYVITRRPSFKIRPWAWYKSSDLFQAWNNFVFINDIKCDAEGFKYDLVDVTRQALQYRAEQLYLKVLRDRYSSDETVRATMTQFLDAMKDITLILAESDHFSVMPWITGARVWATSKLELDIYQLNARNQITLWGPNGEITDYACKQWAEMFLYYYTPRWAMFFDVFLKSRDNFDEKSAQNYVRKYVEENFVSTNITKLTPSMDVRGLALKLYKKWESVDLEDLPLKIVKAEPNRRTTLADVDFSREVEDPLASMWPTTPTV